MKFLLLMCLSMAVLVFTPIIATKMFQKHESPVPVGAIGDNLEEKKYKRSEPFEIEKNSAKKTVSISTYSRLMEEPLAKFLESEPLSKEHKTSRKTKRSGHVRVKKENINTVNVEHAQKLTSKTGHSYPFDDSSLGSVLPQQPGYAEHGGYYDSHYEEPEPIIEIIIKESNQSLPVPPSPPPLPKKKKKEPVQVFYVKYKKEPSDYGEEKVVYEPPVPAITPPTNNDNNDEEEVEDYHHYHEEPVTLPPRPSTTLKAIIRPDSETYHGSGIHITFGGPKDEETSHDNHHSNGGYEEQSAPQPSVALPPKLNVDSSLKINADSQLKKRNPAPFQKPAPQQSFHNGPQFSGNNNFYQPTPVPLFQQNSRFSAQPHPFTPQLSNVQASLPPPSQPPNSQRSDTAVRYSTLPHSQSFSKPQPFLPSHPQQSLQAQQSQQQLAQHVSHTQQLFSINQPHLKSTFNINSRSTSKPYQTISNRVTQYNFPSAHQPTLLPNPSASTFQQSPKPFSHQSRPFPKPAHQFSQPPSSVFPRPTPTSFSQPTQNTFPQPTSNSFPQGSHSFSHSTYSNPQKIVSSGQRTQNLPPPPSPHHPIQSPHHHNPYQQQQQQHHHQKQADQLNQQQQFNQQQRQHLEQLHRQQFNQQLNQQQLQQQQLENFKQLQRQKQSEQFNQLVRQQQADQFQNQQQQQHIQSQSNQNYQKQNFGNQITESTYAPEIVKSISADFPLTSHRFDTKPQILPTSAPHFVQTPSRTQFIHNVQSTTRQQFPQNVPTTPRPQFVKNVKPTLRPQSVQNIQHNQRYTISKSTTPTTEPYKKYTETTQPSIEYITLDPKMAEEERRKKEERRKQNVAALPAEVPEDLRKQLLSSDILGNADIQILDYDKIGDIPIDKLPPEALANFQAVAGSAPVPSVVKPDSEEDIVAEGSDQHEIAVAPPAGVMEMKVVRYNPDSKEGAQIANQYMKEGATQLEPVVLNDSRYNRYLPLKVSGAQFPVPDVPELRGKNVTSVVVLAPVDYEFLQRHEENAEESRAGRSSHPVLEVQGVHFITGDILKTLVKKPTVENYRLWLEKEKNTALDKQSVVLLVIDSKSNGTDQPKEIYMYDIGTQNVNKLSGELSSQFVEVAESNSENDDLEEISDSQNGSFTIKDASQVAEPQVRKQRETSAKTETLALS